jgi:hypothetical protein
MSTHATFSSCFRYRKDFSFVIGLCGRKLRVHVDISRKRRFKYELSGKEMCIAPRGLCIRYTIRGR